MIEAVRPLEEIDPELGKELQLIVNKKHPTVQRLYVGDDVYIVPKPMKAQAKVGRNDPCPWCAAEGITIKYKKCKRHQQ